MTIYKNLRESKRILKSIMNENHPAIVKIFGTLFGEKGRMSNSMDIAIQSLYNERHDPHEAVDYGSYSYWIEIKESDEPALFNYFKTEGKGRIAPPGSGMMSLYLEDLLSKSSRFYTESILADVGVQKVAIEACKKFLDQRNHKTEIGTQIGNGTEYRFINRLDDEIMRGEHG